MLARRTYASGDEMLSEGQPLTELLLLTSGRVVVSKRQMGPREQEIAELDAPAVVGELELVSGEPCNTTVRAVKEVTADALSVEQFEQLLARRDPIAIKLLRNLSRALARKLAETNEVYADLAVWVI